MFVRFTPRALFHACLWTLVCGGFIIVGAQKTCSKLKSGSVTPGGEFDSTDEYIQSLTGAPHGSGLILAALAKCPRNKCIALVLPNTSTKSAFVAQIITYLGWPREVQWVTAKDETAGDQLRKVDPRSVSAVIFWGVKPPDWITGGVQVGPRQIIVPIALVEAGSG